MEIRSAETCGERLSTVKIHRALTLGVILALGGPHPAAAQYAIPAGAGTNRVFSWPKGKRAALSLTFDDARPSQVDVGLPLFARYNAPVTFYVSPDRLQERLAGWRAAVAAGHEIGNHSLTHPCTGNFAFIRTNALEDFTLRRMRRELDQANAVIQWQLGVVPVSFAYPCGQTYVGRGTRVRSYVPVVAREFRTGRLWMSEDSNDPFRCDPAQLLAVEMDGKSFKDLHPLLMGTLRRGRWLILAGHEIGGTAAQTTRAETLDALCAFASDAANELWLSTVGEVAARVTQQRAEVR